MRTLLTAAAIISSAGFGVAKSPTSQPSSPSSVGAYALTSVDAQLTSSFASVRDQADPVPPAPWAIADPADSLYRLAREAMSRGDFKRAAELFHRIPERYPQSAYAGQALYFEAYSLYRSGGYEELDMARDRLMQLKQRYPSIAKKDGDPLLTRVCGELAKRGDEPCAASIGKTAEESNDVTAPETRTIPGSQGRNCSPDADEDSDDRIAALNALLQMDADRA
ncbi:MAG TPA: outer membrane protein assembly factor BamD, partial [Gemmatimonadaceae bacterium]|nr:outer membrane protein assembly factor BamD [Gemmatimonadaceae bacterium]